MSSVPPEKLANLLVNLFGGEALFPVIPFEVLFPSQTEDWPQYLLSMPQDMPQDIAGKNYKIFDLYCQVPSCDCHKVSLAFVDEEGNTAATVSYGWRSTKFYRQWGLDPEGTRELKQGFLDPCAEQSDLASYFLPYFEAFFKRDPDFMTYIKQRYAYVKSNTPEEFSKDSKDSPTRNVFPLKPASSTK